MFVYVHCKGTFAYTKALLFFLSNILVLIECVLNSIDPMNISMYGLSDGMADVHALQFRVSPLELCLSPRDLLNK